MELTLEHGKVDFSNTVKIQLLDQMDSPIHAAPS